MLPTRLQRLQEHFYMTLSKLEIFRSMNPDDPDESVVELISHHPIRSLHGCGHYSHIQQA